MSEEKHIHLSFKSENLAVPEVQTEEIDDEEENSEELKQKKSSHINIVTDTVAVPEITIDTS